MLAYWLQIILQALQALWVRKLRSLLIMIGIVWGTLSVTLLMSLGESFKQSNEAQISAVANGAVYAVVGSTTKAYRGFPAGRKLQIKNEVLDNIVDFVPNVVAVSPMQESIRPAFVEVKAERHHANLLGVSAAYNDIMHVQDGPHVGQFFSSYQVEHQRAVIYLGSRLKDKLFGKALALGQVVKIRGQGFLVIGYDEEDSGNQSFFKNPNSAYIPYTVYNRLSGSEAVNSFWLQSADPLKNNLLEKALQRYLAHRLGYSPEDEHAIAVFDLAKELAFFKQFFNLVQGFLGLCGLLALLVGGVTVSNTLFLSVRQRTREIGLHLALGARPIHISSQFILESLVMVLLAGLVGIILAAVLLTSLSFLPLPDWLGQPTLSWRVLLFTLAILSCLALVAGFFPARKAAKMHPARALLFS